MHTPQSLQQTLTHAAPDLELAFRPMFGGIMAYAAGKPFASLSDIGLALKFTGPAYATFAALPGVHPLRYAPDQPPSKTYLLVPPAILANPNDLRAWITSSLAALPAPKPRKSKL